MSEQSIRPVRDNPIATLATFLEARRDKLKAVMTKGMDPDRIVRIALAAASKEPKIAACTPASIYLSIYQAVQLGIEPNSAAQEGYIVPFGREATFIISFRGLARLAYEGGIVQSITSNVVFEGDEFHVKMGLREDLVHEPAQMHGRELGKAIAVYAVARLRDADPMFTVLWAHEVEKVRASSRSGTSGPWTQWPDAMWKKTAVRRLCKLLPRTGASGRLLGAAIALDDHHESDDTSLVPDVDIAAPEEVVEQQRIEASTPATTRIATEVRERQATKSSAPTPSAPEAKPKADEPKPSSLPLLLDFIKSNGTASGLKKARALFEQYRATMAVDDVTAAEKALDEAESKLGG